MSNQNPTPAKPPLTQRGVIIGVAIGAFAGALLSALLSDLALGVAFGTVIAAAAAFYFSKTKTGGSAPRKDG